MFIFGGHILSSLCRFSSKGIQCVARRRILLFKKPRSIQTMANCSVLDLYDFKFTPEEMRAKADKTMLECKQAYDAIASVPDQDVSLETVLKALNRVERKFYDGFFSIKPIPYIAVDPELRKASSEVVNKYEDFLVEVNLRTDIFHKIQELDKKKLQLDGEYRYFLEKLLESGKRNGLHLPVQVQDEVKKLKRAINEKCTAFCNNVNECNTTLEFSDEDLDGLSQEFIDNLEKSADSGKRIVTLKYPHYIPIMQMCRKPETRKAMNAAFNSRCLVENTEILEEVISLRHKQAVLLGYPNHTSLIATRCQAKNEKTVKKFLEDLHKKLEKRWQEEKKFCLELKEKECKELNLPFDGQLNSWDMSYYCNKLKELKHNVDQKKLQEYFPLAVVTKGMFHIYQKLLGLVFTEVENAKVWHPEVKLFSVANASDGQILGYFFLDLFPRDGKYSHAAIEGIQNNCMLDDGTRQPNIVVMMCNFSPPTADKPSLLMHNEVETYFHEFGHVMHNMCAQNELAHFHTHDIQSDFLEIPSQMLENWCWEKQPLKLMSAHYVTGEPLPDEMIEDLSKSRFSTVGYSNIRQIVFSLFDQEIHSKEKADTAAIYHQLTNDLLGIKNPEGTNFSAQFTHICDIYDARYFGYLWSEVGSADLFDTVFKGSDLLDPVLGKKYREEILEPSGAKDSCEILKSFLGRDMSQDAFLRISGLKV